MCDSRTCRLKQARGAPILGSQVRHRGPPMTRRLLAGGVLPSGEQPVHCAVDVEMVGLAATRYNDVRAAEESHKDAPRYLEQRITVRTGQCEGDEVTTRGCPRPHAYVADTGW